MKNSPKAFRNQYFSFLVLAISVTILPCSAQQMTKGVSVKMAHTTNASTVPAADEQDAVVIVINDKGSIFDGVEPVSAEALVSRLKKHSTSSGDVYVKADARANYKCVLAVLEALHESGIERPVLLTAQSEPVNGRTLPTGLRVELGDTAQQGQVTVQLLHGRNRQIARIGGKDVPQPDWPSTLRDSLRGGKTVLVTAGGDISYADVIGLIDSVRAAGAQMVVLKRS